MPKHIQLDALKYGSDVTAHRSDSFGHSCSGLLQADLSIFNHNLKLNSIRNESIREKERHGSFALHSARRTLGALEVFIQILKKNRTLGNLIHIILYMDFETHRATTKECSKAYYLLF